MTLNRFFISAAGTMLVLALQGCGSNIPGLESAQQELPAPTTSSARMYLPQFRGEMDFSSEAERAVSTPATGKVDPTVWAELTAELSRQLTLAISERQASLRPTGDANFVEISITGDGAGGYQLEWQYVNAGDYDFNGEVNISDLVQIGMHYGKNEQSPDWETALSADGDCNGEVNISDVTPIGRHFRASCEGYNIYTRDEGDSSFVLLGSISRDEGSGKPMQYVWPLSSIQDEYVVVAFDVLGDDRPINPIVKPGTTLLESSGLSIIAHTGDLITLSGDVSSLAPGDVIVSGEGEGFLGIVDNISPSGTDHVVQYTQGTLEDLFDFTEINFHDSFNYADIQGVDTFVDGVELVSASVSDAEGSRVPSDIGDIVIKFKEHEFGAKSGDYFYGLTLQGEVSFKLDIDADVEIGSSWEDFGTLYAFNFGISGETAGSVTAKAVVKRSWTGEARKVMSIYGAPIPVTLVPVPVIFTPQLDIYMGLLGEVEIAATFTPTVTMKASAGLSYTRSGEWDPYFDHSVNGEFGWEKTNLYGKVQLDLNLLSPQPTLKIYGVAGPYAKFHAPYFRIAAQVQANPPEFSVTGYIGARAWVGAEVNILGRSLAKYELGGEPVFNVLMQLYQAKWPLFDSELQLIIDWEAESHEDLGQVDLAWTPDRAEVIRPHVVWYPLVSGFSVGSVSGGHPSNNGSLDQEPYALWTETVDVNTKGEPQSGTVSVYIGRMINPARYVVRLENEWTWPVRIRKITVNGAFTGSHTFSDDVTLYKGYWDPLELETDEGTFTWNDAEEEPGYFPLL